MTKEYLEPKKGKCLQTNTGSCLGYNILNIVVERVNRQGGNAMEIAHAISQKYCPEAGRMQTHHLRPIRKYSMGQPSSNLIEVRS